MSNKQSHSEILTNSETKPASNQHFAIAQGKQVLEISQPIRPVSEVIIDYIKTEFNNKLGFTVNR